jgi:hypothetical protein
MGRRSRELKERRERRARDRYRDAVHDRAGSEHKSRRAEELEEELKRLKDGDATFWNSKDCPEDVRVSNLEDILAFESVGSGVSLFEGLEQHGIDLPPPEKLDEEQSAMKAVQVVRALACLRIFLIGWESMAPREFYSTLWRETLWEGCYVEKRNPAAVTLIDVSHKLTREDFRRYLEDLEKSATIH